MPKSKPILTNKEVAEALVRAGVYVMPKPKCHCGKEIKDDSNNSNNGNKESSQEYVQELR